MGTPTHPRCSTVVRPLTPRPGGLRMRAPQLVALNRMRAGTKVIGRTADGDVIVKTPRSGTQIAVPTDGRLAIARLPACSCTEVAGDWL
jgi:hypothetical protein